MKPQLASTQFHAPFDGWSPAELLAHFQRRDTVRYFPIVDETQTLRAKADQILSNRFDFNEEAYELRPGFDWTANPSADVEWLILLTDYHHIALRNFLYAIRLAALNGIEMSAELHSLVRRALEFSLYAHKPDGWIPALSDGDTGSFLPLLKQGYELYGDKAMLYVATKGKQGRPPASRSRGFEQSGYYILRSGWGEREPFGDERYLIFDCGPLGAGNHGHLDLLSFEMSAYGQSLIVDPGRFTYHEPPPDSGETNWRALFRGTGYHNTALVDDKNQTRYEFHKGKFRVKGEAPQHELKAFVSHDGFDYLHGVARSREYEVAHERKIVFLCPDYWLVVDRLLSEAPHDYRQLFHLSERAYGRTSMSVERRTLLIDSPRLIIAHAAEPDVAPSIKEGFVSPVYGVKHAAPVVSFARRAAGACYHTVLYPYKADRPEITLERLPVQSGGRTCPETEASALRVTVTAGSESFNDVFLLIHRQGDEAYQCGSIRFRGRALRLRTDGEGRRLQRHLLT